jgi:hypothetical protein
MKNKKSQNEVEQSSNKKIDDRHLDIPSEANRDKHINFTALENDDKDPADEPITKKFTNSNKRRQTQR